VKELLGLDHFEAVIRGLHSVGNVRRLREPVPSYWDARERIPKLRMDLQSIENERLQFIREQEEIGTRLRHRVEQLDRNLLPLVERPQELVLRLAEAPEEVSLLNEARLRRDLAAALQQLQALAVGPELDRSHAEAEDAESTKALEAWRAGPGIVFQRVFDELIGLFPDLPPAEAGRERARLAAKAQVDLELARCSEVLTRANADDQRILNIEENLRQGRTRVALLAEQIASHAGAAGTLAQALLRLMPHIHTDDCPVCGRDFGEISRKPLRAHVSERVSALTEEAASLSALAQDKATTAAAVVQAERDLEEVVSRRLPSPERDALKTRRARLSEIQQLLNELQESAQTADRLIAAARGSGRQLADLASRDQASNALRESVVTFAARLGVSTSDIPQPLGQALRELQTLVGAREAALSQRQSLRREAIQDFGALNDIQKKLQPCELEIGGLRTRLSRLEMAMVEADRRIRLARDLARRALEERNRIARRVFNDELNAVWRDLFVRLAPDEPFVPAFGLPEGSGAEVEGILETHYREGGKGEIPLQCSAPAISTLLH
jgi:exonuclease SbcC